jgi:hypothetical protein
MVSAPRYPMLCHGALMRAALCDTGANGTARRALCPFLRIQKLFLWLR